MAEIKAGETPLWWQRSRHEYALRCFRSGPQRVLIHRFADEKGQNSDGCPAIWKDLAVFDNAGDAEMVLRELLGGEPDVTDQGASARKDSE